MIDLIYIKSVTQPFFNLSNKLPTAPPKANAEPILRYSDTFLSLINLKNNIPNIAVITEVIHLTILGFFSNLLYAIPVFLVFKKYNFSGNTSLFSQFLIFLFIACLDNKSNKQLIKLQDMYFIIFPSLFSYYIFKVYIFNNVANNHLKYYTLNVYLFQLNTFIERWLKPMALVTTKKMFEKAFEGKYAIGAFNINNMEIIQGVVSAAKKQNSAIILQVSKSALKYAHPLYLKKMVDAAIEETGLDIALHLDHGSDFEVCRDCIEYGFTSVMFDGSHLDYEENVAKTKEIVEYAHAHGVVVEAELGKLAGVEDEVKVTAGDATYTDPDQALDFVTRTGVDSLAIAIGTSHGAYKFKGEAKLDFDRLALITEKLEAAGFHNYPIVLHGASSVDPDAVAMCNAHGGQIDGAKGIPVEMLRKASSMAVCKINMDTDIRLAMTAAIRKSFDDDPKAFDPRGYLGAGRDYIEQMIENKIKNVIGSTDSMNDLK